MNYSSQATNQSADAGEHGRQSAAPAVAALIRVLLVLEAGLFAVASLLHAGVRLPVGFTEPVIVAAAIAEGLIALIFAIAAFAVFSHRSWAWAAALFAHLFAAAGILIGITALSLGGGLSTNANYIYHRVMLVVAGTILVLLLTPIGRAALGGPTTKRGAIS